MQDSASTVYSAFFAMMTIQRLRLGWMMSACTTSKPASCKNPSTSRTDIMQIEHLECRIGDVALCELDHFS